MGNSLNCLRPIDVSKAGQRTRKPSLRNVWSNNQGNVQKTSYPPINRSSNKISNEYPGKLDLAQYMNKHDMQMNVKKQQYQSATNRKNVQNRDGFYSFDYGKVKSLQEVKSINEYYEFGEKLGQGCYGTVLEATNKRLNIQCAVKVIQKDSVFQSKSRIENLENELTILESVNFQYIACIYEMLHDESNFYIVSEIVKTGNLYQYLDSVNSTGTGRIQEQEIKEMCKQLFSTLNYLHKNNIVHRDIKLENLLVKKGNDGKLQISLIDFGFASYFQDGQDLSKRVGSRLNMAPEPLNNNKYNYKVDIWSTTVIIFILLFGNFPYKGRDHKEIAHKIKSLDLNSVMNQNPAASQEAKEFIMLGLQQDRSRRGTSQQMLSHPWLRDVDYPSTIQIQTDSIHKTMFYVRAGHNVGSEWMETLVTKLYYYDGKVTKNLDYDQLVKKYGQVHAYLLINRFLKQLPHDIFWCLADQLAQQELSTQLSLDRMASTIDRTMEG